jgi:hypothetical protein
MPRGGYLVEDDNPDLREILALSRADSAGDRECMMAFLDGGGSGARPEAA